MAGVAGTWYGQRDARLELRVALDGRLEGRYYTTNKDETHSVFEVIGMSDTCSFGGCRSVGFVVCWNNEYVNQHSVTSWSGQYRVVNGVELLTTNWLLTR
ncbi:MAG TPA: avidin/streptavidin family protein, partial [Phototrophicaceae bacterium]|nr:avidin/streptavidin family protein [Phototrophicaceae bacterium]